jgi:hypothetical protein
MSEIVNLTVPPETDRPDAVSFTAKEHDNDRVADMAPFAICSS